MINAILLSGHLVVDPLVWQVPLMVLVFIVALAYLYFIRIYIAVKMAAKRNRSTIGWGLFSFLISPIGAWILLAILGKYVPPDK